MRTFHVHIMPQFGYVGGTSLSYTLTFYHLSFALPSPVKYHLAFSSLDKASANLYIKKN